MPGAEVLVAGPSAFDFLVVPDRPLMREPIFPLTSLRLFAALHVVVYHCGLAQLPGVPAWLQRLAGHGDLAVSLFFVLSGFILCVVYAPRERGGSVDVGEFRAARFARVYPIYLLGLLVSAPIYLSGQFPSDGTGSLLEILLVLLLVQSWLPQTALVWNSPAWSLSCEAFFYLVFPGMLARSRRLRGRRLLLAMAALALLSLAGPVTVDLLAPQSNALHSLVRFRPLLRLPEFLLGIVLGRLYLQRPNPRDSSWLCAAALAASLLVATTWDLLPWSLELWAGMLAPLFAVMIFGLARGGGLLGRILSVRLLVFGGEISYAIYILHVPLSRWHHKLAGALFGEVNPHCWTFFLVNSAAIVLWSAVAHLAIERPGRRLLRGWLITRRRSSVAASDVAART